MTASDKFSADRISAPRSPGLHATLPDRARWPGLPIATIQCVRFYSRLPMPRLGSESDPHGVPDFRIVPRALPLAALVIAMPAAACLWALDAGGLSATLCAAIAITVLVLSTGAFHEDGLADSADGLFGGHDVERRLEIMKDSRVGTFGAVALGLSLILRIAALAAIAESAGGATAAIVILVAAAWSRGLGIKILADDAPARAYGAAAAVGQPTRATTRIALAASLAITIAGFSLAGLGPHVALLALVLAGLLAALMAHLARRLIGGQTGDIAGAGQQLAEIGFYIGVAATI
jgi:adenosylcobinamide-GDP ribazoletransferase